MTSHQQHLDYRERVNLGSYYTDTRIVDTVWRMLRAHLRADSVVLDSSCGYGNFLKADMPYRQIGADIDEAAIKTASEASSHTRDGHHHPSFPRKRESRTKAISEQNRIAFHTVNALSGPQRSRYRIEPDVHLCIIGNPPYNDRTSLIRNRIKRDAMTVDDDIKTRDLGMSFLLSYGKLAADVVCVLHPLSYLIKRANFNAIRKFTSCYKLADGTIISSGVFKQASKSMHFPILIGLYVRSDSGFTHDEALDFKFKVTGGSDFTPSQFDDISRYVRKYPDKSRKPGNGDILFWTLRDINALKRNRTFVEKPSDNTIIVDRRCLDYYVYIDVVKHFAHHIPYYFGNCDVPIDAPLFSKYRSHFILDCLRRHPNLTPHYPSIDPHDEVAAARARKKIQQYLQQLLGPHYGRA